MLKLALSWSSRPIVLRETTGKSFLPSFRHSPAASSDLLSRIAARVHRQPEVILAVFMALHLLVWTLVPALVHTGMPMDVVEGYVVGREWVIGTFKHPAMPSWLLEMSRLLFSATGWPAYLLSSICVIATYHTIYLLGRDMTDAPRGVAGALLLSGVLYFSWVSPEFNHNVLQMPFWAGIILALWRARQTGSNGWWAMAGALAAGGIYAKFSTAVLLVVVAAYVLFDRKCRRAFAVGGPWIGLGVFFVLVTPLVNWLVDTNFLLFEYAEARAVGGRAGNVVLFVWKQIASSAGLIALLLLAAARWPASFTDKSGADKSGVDDPVADKSGAGNSGGPAARMTTDAGRDASTDPADAARFIAVFYMGPIALIVFCAAASGVGLKGAWGTSMLSLAGVAMILLADRLRIPLALQRISAGAFLLLAVIPLAYAASVTLSDRFSKSPPRVAWPQGEITARLQKIWWERTGQPLRIVAGDLWIGGMVAANAKDRPSLLIDGDLARSPWLDRAMLERYGALIVAWRRMPMPSLQEFPHVRVLAEEGTEIFRINFGRQGRDLPVYYAIVPPGTKLKFGELQKRRR